MTGRQIRLPVYDEAKEAEKEAKESDWARRNYGTRWLTSDELRFVRKLGSHSVSLREGLLASQHVKQLKQYLQTMDLRSKWGDIKPDKVRAHVNSLIEGYESIQKRKEAS